jgi:MacB-like periplasmic core domain
MHALRDFCLKTHLENLCRDFHHAVRNLRKDLRFAFVAILTLALGIGSTTAIFSMIDCTLRNPYPYKNADRLATFTGLAGDQFREWRYPVAAFFDFKEQNHTFDDMIGLVYREVRFANAEGADQFFAGSVTPDTFDVLGIKPLLGRPITAEDAKPSASPVIFCVIHLPGLAHCGKTTVKQLFYRQHERTARQPLISRQYKNTRAGGGRLHAIERRQTTQKSCKAAGQFPDLQNLGHADRPSEQAQRIDVHQHGGLRDLLGVGERHRAAQ